MRRLLIATIVSVLSGVPALGAVCVAACVPAGASHHVAAASPAEVPAEAEAQHHHGHDAHDMSVPVDAPEPVVALSSLSAADEDCGCCMTPDAVAEAAVVVPRLTVSPGVALVYVPGAAATPTDGGFASTAPVESFSGPPPRPPVSQSVLRL